MSDKILKNIIIILICATLVLSNILIGVPTGNNTIIINIIVTTVAMIFMISKKIVKKEAIIENKLDLCVLILCLSSAIPVILNAYTTLTGSINYILKYLTAFFIYIVIKDITKENKKVTGYIINITIISAIILTFIGIDKMTTNNLLPITRAIGSVEIEYEETRMDSLFSYANAFAAFCSMALFLAIGKYLKADKQIIKFLYVNAIFILESAILLSYSRTIFIFIAMIFLVYLILIKKKDVIFNILATIIITGIFSIIYTNLYMNFLASGSYLNIWISLILFSILSSIITIMYSKINHYIVKIKLKYIIAILITVFIILIAIILIGLNMKSELVMFNSTNASKEIKKEIYQIEGNHEYKFEFEIQSKSMYEKTDIFKISILEKNKYFDDIKQTDLEFGNFEGKKEINITTDIDTTEIFIIFTSKIVSEDTYLKINNLYINGQEEILNYKFLPSSLVSKIKNINLNTKSAWERGVFIIDSLKLIKDNWLFGIGGDGWQYEQGQVQEYLYGTKEVHSYPMQVFLEFGIIGFLALIGIVFLIIRNSYLYLKGNKEKDSIELISILCSILIIFTHSFLDFDMSFTCIMIEVFAFLGILNNYIMANIELRHTKNIINVLVFIVLIPILGINIINYLEYQYVDMLNDENNIDEKYEILLQANRYPTYILPLKEENIYLNQKNNNEEERNQRIIENSKWILKYEKNYNTLEICKTAINAYSGLENIEYNNYIEEIEKLCNRAINSKINKKYSITENWQRQVIYIEIGKTLINKYKEKNDEKLLNLAKEIYGRVIIEYEETLNRVKDYQKCRYKKEETERKLKIIEENYKNAIKYIEEL